MNSIKSTRFSQDTDVSKIDDGVYHARIDQGWWVMRGPNGGYVAALLERAIEKHVDDPTRHPRSLTIHYLSPPTEGEVEILVSTERSGRTLSSLSIRMIQGGHLRALGLASLSEHRKGFQLDHRAMPNVPEAASLTPETSFIPIHERYDQRYIEDFHKKSDPNQASVAAWIRLAEPQSLDYPLLAAYSDALRPSVFSLVPTKEEVGPVPTIDLTLHYRSDLDEIKVAPDAFCLAVCRSRFAKHGYIEEDGEVWSSCGTLLLQSRQLAAMVTT